MATPAIIAASRAAGIDSVTLPTTAAANAAARNWPSIETLTTPARSQSTPHSAPKTSGVARERVPANWLLTGNGRSRPEAAQVRKPTSTAAPATVRHEGRHPAPHPPGQEGRRRHQAEHRADRHGGQAGHGQRGQLDLVEGVGQGEPGLPAGRGQADQQQDTDHGDQDPGGEPLPALLGRLDAVRTGGSRIRRGLVSGRRAHASPPSGTGPISLAGRALTNGRI